MAASEHLMVNVFFLWPETAETAENVMQRKYFFIKLWEHQTMNISTNIFELVIVWNHSSKTLICDCY